MQEKCIRCNSFDLIYFPAVDRCLSFEYAIGNEVHGNYLTQLNVYVAGTGKAKTNVKHIKTSTNYAWQSESVSVEAVDNLVVRFTISESVSLTPQIYTLIYVNHLLHCIGV
jgi:hypothetical protein